MLKQKSARCQALAINGGKPVRTQPLPAEWCGAHWIDDQEVQAVARVVRARSPFRFYGFDLQAEAEALERDFAKYTGRKHALAVSSGTAALQVALGAMGVGPGDEVIVPGYFWVATAAAVIRSGAVPVVVDVDDTWSLDPKVVEQKITPRTRAIIVVHMGGVIGEIEELMKVARRHRVMVLEDCAQAAGASQGGKKAGAFGDMAIFSFQLNKHMTSGEGGMIVTDDDKLHRRASGIHDLGYPRNKEGRLDFSDPECQLWGIGCRMSELAAAMARVQLSKLESICGAMRKAKLRIKRALAPYKEIAARRVIEPDGDAGSFIYLTFKDAATSKRFLEALRAEGVVGPKGGMYPIHMENWGLHIYYNIPSLVNKRGNGRVSVWDMAENKASQVSYGKGTCPNLDSMVERSIIFCVASVLSKSDVDDIVKAVEKVASQVL